MEIGSGMGKWPDVCPGMGQDFYRNSWEDRPLFLELWRRKPGVAGSHSVTMRWESVWEQTKREGSGEERWREIWGEGEEEEMKKKIKRGEEQRKEEERD